MPETLPRPLLVLVAIVAIVVVVIGVKDYIQRQSKATPSDTPSSTVVNPKAIKAKKTTSAKTKRAGTSATEAHLAAKAQAVPDDMEKPFISQEFANAGTNAIVVMDNGLNTVRTQAVHDQLEPAMDRNNRVRNEVETITKHGLSSCLPLPNMTKPGDVDAPSYENWAREYCGSSLDLDPDQLPSDRKIPEYQQSKK